MTQFMLCVPNPDVVPSKLELRRIEHDEVWLTEIARALFPRATDLRVPRAKNGASISDLFTEAHDALYNGSDFDVTELKAVLPEMIDVCESFALWWGDEWSDLPVITTESALRSELEKQLNEEVGEVYLRWNREE